MEDLLAHLNEAQKKAVIQAEGPTLILAGAGSGKTRVLTHKVAYLIKQKKVSAQQILVTTFTNKAAAEMKKRIQALVGGSDIPMVGTFHWLCVKILRRDGQAIGIAPGFVIYDS